MSQLYQQIVRVLKQYMGELAESFLIVELMRTNDSYLPLASNLPDHLSAFLPDDAPLRIKSEDLPVLLGNLEEACTLIFGPKETSEIVAKLDYIIGSKASAQARAGITVGVRASR